MAQDGSLTLFNGTAGSTPMGTSPIDLALSAGSQYLYSLASGTISEFRVAADGSLTSIGSDHRPAHFHRGPGQRAKLLRRVSIAK